MTKKKLVYSTNPNQPLNEDENEDVESLTPDSQRLRIRLETKQRAGKKATVVHGFLGNQSDLEALAKQLKTKIGVGGTVKDGEVIIQGDYVSKIKDLLISLGYKNTK